MWEEEGDDECYNCGYMNIEVFFGCFGVDDFVHHGGGEVALAVQVEPCEEGDDLVEHGENNAEGKGGEENIG